MEHLTPVSALIGRGLIGLSAAMLWLGTGRIAGIGKRRGSPFFGDGFATPARKDFDLRLVAGAGLFGIGWGLVGYCPGPALASLTVDGWKSVVFVGAMLAGMATFKVFDSRSITRDPQSYPPRP